MPIIVNDEVIDDALVREEARQLRPRYQEATQGMDPMVAEKQLREWSRENVIEKTLLRQAALKLTKPVPDEEVDRVLREVTQQSGGQAACRTGSDQDQLRNEVQMQLRVEALLRQVTGGLKPPRYKELTEHYRKHREEFWRPETIAVRHIVKNVDERQAEAVARAAIEEIERRLKAGEDFEKLADEMSDCPGSGGDVGWFPRGEMVDEFDAVVFDLEPGETSGIFRTAFGFHIARPYDRLPEGVPSFPEVKEKVEARLMGEKRQRAVEQYLDRLRKEADIRLVSEAEIAK